MNTKVKHYTPTIELNMDELSKVLNQYHFKEDDFNQLLSVYSLVAFDMNPTIYVDYSMAYDEIDLDNYAVTIITLGEKIDLLSDKFLSDGKILEAYMVDCISLSLLSKLYRELAPIVHKETSLTISELSFLGDKFPLSLTPEIVASMELDDIKCNESYMLMPLKSVCIILPLSSSEHSVDKTCDVCSNCGNLSCTFKKNDVTNQQILTYGYQTIFGKKNLYE